MSSITIHIKLIVMKMILLIDDNEPIRSNTAEILELSDYKVIVAENGKEGLEMAIKYHPDLIVCDILMPEIDGYGVLQAVRRNEAIGSTPFIFLTAMTERSEFRQGMDMGADDYISKPFDGIDLLKAIEARLNKQEIVRPGKASGFNSNDLQTRLSTANNTLHFLAENRNINKLQ